MELNRIAENIAYKLGDQFNHTLNESIKDTLIFYRAKYIRDDLERNPVSHMDFVQSFTLNLIEVNLLKAFKANAECIGRICGTTEYPDKYTVAKSKEKLPKSVRLKGKGKDYYIFVGSVDGFKRFQFVTLDQYQFIKDLPYRENTIYYTVIDDYLYIINNLNCNDLTNSLDICNVLIKGIFVDPRQIWSFCTSERFIDDNDFPIAEDMLMSINQNILRGEYPLMTKDGEEIKIKPDKDDNND